MSADITFYALMYLPVAAAEDQNVVGIRDTAPADSTYGILGDEFTGVGAKLVRGSAEC